jgi:hypothetical protein
MDRALTADLRNKDMFTQKRSDDSIVENRRGQIRADTLTSENVFKKVLNLLDGMGFRSLSIERSEDFTERIDAIFTRQGGIGESGSSGYLRILTVYRTGKNIHVELYNFLSKFPADEMEMGEVKKALKGLFSGNTSVEIEVHE